MQKNEQSFKFQAFCSVHWAPDSDMKGLMNHKFIAYQYFMPAESNIRLAAAVAVFSACLSDK
jgi:hypothetical protein